MTDLKTFREATADQLVVCPVCGSKEYAVLYESGDYEYDLPGTFYISCCKGCGLIYQNPRPTLAEILRYYPEWYEPYNTFGPKIIRSIRHHLLVRSRIRKYCQLFSGKAGRIKVLDVGCANGELLNELSSHSQFECAGVEPVTYAADIAARHGFFVYNSTLEDAKIPDVSFDLVIMNHVLEHMPDPVKTVKKAFSVLKEDGILSGELPCVSSLERIIFGRYWGMYHMPRHLTFFSKELIERFLREIGFKEVEIDFQPVPSTWHTSIRNFLNSKGAPRQITKYLSEKSLLCNFVTFPLALFAAMVGHASIMHFTARK